MGENDQLRLIPGDGEEPDAGRWSGEVTGEGLEAEARLSALRLLNQPADEPGVYEEAGGGNPEQRRLTSLKTDIVRAFTEIGENYPDLTHKDQNAYKLQLGLQAIYGLSETTGWKVEDYIGRVAKDPNGRNASARLYDGLTLMRTAFNFAIPENPREPADGQAALEQFINDMCPTNLWQHEELKAQVLKGIRSANMLAGMMSSPNHKSIDSLMAKMQNELVRQGLGMKVKTRRDSPAEQANFKRHLGNARAVAWNEWQQAVEP